MAVAVAQTAPDRHPWLAALIAAPEAELRALVGGYADVAPYGRAEPADAAASLLFGLAEDDPARQAFDQGCRALLETMRAALLSAGDPLYERHLATLDRLLAVLRRTRPLRALRDLHARYAHWFHPLETAVIDRSLDLRREFWRVLALSQDVRTDTAAPRRLMPLWFELCAEAGPLGRYAESYLDVGLIGLRRLPLGHDDDSNEEAVCHGLARWAARQRPAQGAFLARWREIESAYPRTPMYWPPLVADVIAATEEYLAQETERGPVSFPAAAWWREELELPVVRPGQRPPPSGRKRPIEPPPREMREAVLRDAASAIAGLRPRVERLLTAHRRYADATGDTYFLVRTACNVGMRLLREMPAERAARGAVATTLAREALDYAPGHVFAWALWRDALAAQGALDAAEQVGWEALRRYPENPQWRTQLATLLDQQLGRAAEAERLLRETVLLFPLNPAARPQLATLLADRLDQPEDAAALLREAIEVLPDNPHSYTQLATLLADRLGRPEEAAALLRHAVEIGPDNPYNYTQLAIVLADRLGQPQAAIDLLRRAEQRKAGDAVTRTLLSRLLAGQPVRSRARQAPAPRTAAASVTVDLDLPAARARRALFRVETATAGERDAALAEVRRVLADDPSLAYARYVAQRTGAAPPGARPDTGFAFAFERAARAGSTPAFEALLKHALGMELYVARAGLALVSNAAAFELPPGANDLEPAALSRRFALLAGEVSAGLARPNADRMHLLRLLSDFAATDLSRERVA